MVGGPSIDIMGRWYFCAVGLGGGRDGAIFRWRLSPVVCGIVVMGSASTGCTAAGSRERRGRTRVACLLAWMVVRGCTASTPSVSGRGEASPVKIMTFAMTFSCLVIFVGAVVIVKCRRPIAIRASAAAAAAAGVVGISAIGSIRRAKHDRGRSGDGCTGGKHLLGCCCCSRETTLPFWCTWSVGAGRWVMAHGGRSEDGSSCARGRWVVWG